MRLAKKVIFRDDEMNYTILKHMGYSAYKLWNVANYEKRNYKDLGFDSYPNWYDQEKRLKENFFYKNLPSQTAQNVLKRLEEAWKSYFALLKSGKMENPRPPRFKQNVMYITFIQNAIVMTDDGVRLSIPKQLKEYLRTQDIDADFIYLKTEEFSDIHIKQIEIHFMDNGTFAAVAVYEIPDVPKLEDNGQYLSIDLGLGNSMDCFDSDTGDSFIVRGFMDATHYFDKKIAYYQSIHASAQRAEGVKYPKPTKRVSSLYQKKANRVTNFLHQASRLIADYCHKNNIHTVVIGDIKGIRKNKNLGRTNQQLHAFPYARFYQLLEYKLALYGITMEKQKESYSSQCPPDSKRVSKRYAKKSNRKHRGLYVSDGNVYNADSVGAYNILRLYQQRKGLPISSYQNLSSPVVINL